jgi:hypothetical protein
MINKKKLVAFFSIYFFYSLMPYQRPISLGNYFLENDLISFNKNMLSRKYNFYIALVFLSPYHNKTLTLL